MNLQGLTDFCNRWLDTWTGNRPEALIEFYSADAFYRDPARPVGLRGKEELLGYFKKLLAKNPHWIWKAKELIQTERGFVLKWTANIPTASSLVIVDGLDIVELQDERITRNEVYFDTSPLLGVR